MMFLLNADIIYALFMGLIVSSVFLFFIGSVAIRGFKYVADIPRGVLFPAVLVLCIFGVFAVNNSIFDVGVMFAMGWVGYFMLRYKIPAAPFLIAFILGPLLEDNFRQAMLMSGSSPAILFRTDHLVLFWTLTAISVFAHHPRGHQGDAQAQANGPAKPGNSPRHCQKPDEMKRPKPQGRPDKDEKRCPGAPVFPGADPWPWPESRKSSPLSGKPDHAVYDACPGWRESRYPHPAR